MTLQSQQNLYLSDPKIQFLQGSGWQETSSELIKDIIRITVEESLHMPAMFSLTIHNSYIPTNNRDEHKEWRYQDRGLFEIGQKVRIGFVSSVTGDTHFDKKQEDFIFEGEITAVEVHFNDKSAAPIIIRGYDLSHRLHRGRHNRSFLNETDSSIVRKIAKEAGIKAGKNIEETSESYDYIFQENQTNMQFLRERAAAIGYELFIQGDELYFRKPQSQDTLNLKWLVDINSFSARVTSAEQVGSVEVRSWDYTQKRVISATATAEKVVTKTGNPRGSSTNTKFDINPRMTVVDRPVATAKQAEKMAQALCDELGGEFVYADAKAEGNPKIRPGKIIKLAGMGDRFKGEYYVTETRHLYQQRIYKTEFSVRGLRAGNLFSTLAPAVHLQPGQTFLVGIVTDNQDPQGWGRVKVKFPTLTEDHASYWARVVALGAAHRRGFDCLPEINDEVLVGFEHGDIHRPYILGGVWNGKDAPPESVKDSIQGGKVRLRTIATRTGHKLQFVEEDKGSSKAGVRVETTGGHKIYLNDSDASIEIETKGGHKISMKDRGSSISIDSTGNMSLNAKGNIDIKANGMISINGATISLN